MDTNYGHMDYRQNMSLIWTCTRRRHTKKGHNTTDTTAIREQPTPQTMHRTRPTLRPCPALYGHNCFGQADTIGKKKNLRTHKLWIVDIQIMETHITETLANVKQATLQPTRRNRRSHFDRPRLLRILTAFRPRPASDATNSTGQHAPNLCAFMS